MLKNIYLNFFSPRTENGWQKTTLLAEVSYLVGRFYFLVLSWLSLPLLGEKTVAVKTVARDSVCFSRLYP